MVVTPHAHIAARIRSLRNQGRPPSGAWLQHAELGYNYRLSDIACTLGIGQMHRLPEILARREAVARLYHQHLAPEPDQATTLTLPPLEIPHARISWFVFVVRLAEAFTAAHRDQILHDLEAAGIGCGRYFAPIHLQPAYADIPHLHPLPITESIAPRTIALPFFNRIQESQIADVCDTLQRSIRRIR
jgi:perosamine synthetase